MDGETIFSIYKGREDVEQSFDAMKNELEEDKTYLQDDESIWGYFFITFPLPVPALKGSCTDKVEGPCW